MSLGWDWPLSKPCTALGSPGQGEGGQEALAAASLSVGRPQLGDLFLLPVPNLFGSKEAVFFHIKMFGFVLLGSNKFYTVHIVFLIFQRHFIAAFDFKFGR